MKKGVIILLLILSCTGIMGLKLKLDEIPREKVPGASIIYIPSGKYLKYAAFGYTSFLADMIYLWAIQYFSTQTIPERFTHLDHVFSIIAELDPRYFDPYEIGALIAFFDARDFELCFKILDKGLEKNPEQWIFPLEAGHYAQLYLKDYKTAQDYYKKAMEIEGSPAITRRLYANAAFGLSDYQTALRNWLEIYQIADNERIKKFASNHIYRTKAAIDITALTEAVARFKQQYGRNPDELSQLVSTSLLKSIPQDMDGTDYEYNSQTGEVTSQTWWKR
jgi:tetratricopeptide (TPR) repeat protein